MQYLIKPNAELGAGDSEATVVQRLEFFAKQTRMDDPKQIQ